VASGDCSLACSCSPLPRVGHHRLLTFDHFGDFVAASIGMVPGAFVYAYAGKVTGEALALAGQAQVPRDASYYTVLLAGLAATVAATTIVTRTARKALQDV
jgi:uncharacterized membrane protein YdjX (TVP38/TMEM64 family)